MIPHDEHGPRGAANTRLVVVFGGGGDELRERLAALVQHDESELLLRRPRFVASRQTLASSAHDRRQTAGDALVRRRAHVTMYAPSDGHRYLERPTALRPVRVVREQCLPDGGCECPLIWVQPFDARAIDADRQAHVAEEHPQARRATDAVAHKEGGGDAAREDVQPTVWQVVQVDVPPPDPLARPVAHEHHVARVGGDSHGVSLRWSAATARGS